MNFTTLKARVQLNAGNMQSTHPLATYVPNYVNDGTRMVIMRASMKFPNFELFPEHKDVEWTDVTVADQDYLTLPTDQIAIRSCFSSDSSTAPNLNNTGWRLLTYMEPEAFDQLGRPTTQIAYPTNWTLRENRVYLYPTPRATKTAYVKLDGIQDEPDMSAGTDTPRTHIRWHPAILDFASHLLLNDMGWVEDAKRFKDSADDKINTIGGSMMGLRRANVKRAVRISGAPRGF